MTTENTEAMPAALDDYDIEVLRELCATLEHRSASRHAALTKALAALSQAEQRQEEAIPKSLDVRKIMLRVVPDEDGNPVEVYAESVADVEAELSRMGERLEEYELGIRRYQPQPEAVRPGEVLTVGEIDEVRQSLAGSEYTLFDFARAISQRTVSKLAEKRGTEIRGWENPETGEVISASKKKDMEEFNGSPGKRLAKTYTIPLYTTPPPDATLLQVRNVIEQEPAVMIHKWKALEIVDAAIEAQKGKV